jgi:hypothetical protein
MAVYIGTSLVVTVMLYMLKSPVVIYENGILSYSIFLHKRHLADGYFVKSYRNTYEYIVNNKSCFELYEEDLNYVKSKGFLDI